ncbi:hypothetical protein ACTWPT_56265 [Nonomuraea sp. 3N208]|uniref:hypothetical protein n=1 Tax=Nonomuraea sp. 3N208 TaxID=3457421 RepID=UPI003FD67074
MRTAMWRPPSRYLIASGDQREAADLLIAADDEFLDGGAAATYLRLAEGLDEAPVRADPCLAIAMAAAAGFSGRPDRADRLLDAAEAGLTGDDRPPRGWTSARAAIGTLRATFGPAAKLAAAVEEARRAVELEHDPTRDGYVISRLTLGVVLAGLDQQADALALLGAARRGSAGRGCARRAGVHPADRRRSARHVPARRGPCR